VVTREWQLAVGVNGRDDCRDKALLFYFGAIAILQRNEQERDLKEAEEWFEVEM
jgi:hypothetical protein